MYRDGHSRNACAARFGAARMSVTKLLKASKIEVRSSPFACKAIVNEAAFDDPEHNEAAAYWIGFLMGDGCVAVNKTSSYVMLGLSVVDRKHVEAFRQFIGCSNPVAVQPAGKRNGPMATFSVASNALVQSLRRFGVIRHKTHVAKVIGLASNRHFWRGVVDADGWVGFARRRSTLHPSLSLVGARPLINQFASFARSFSDVTASVNPCRDSWQFCPRGHYAVQIIHHIYADCQIALPRKLKSANKVLQFWSLDPLQRFSSRYKIREATITVRRRQPAG